MAGTIGADANALRARLVRRKPVWVFVPLAALIGMAPAALSPIIMAWAVLAYGLGLWTFAGALKANPHRGRVEVFARGVGLGMLGALGAALSIVVAGTFFSGPPQDAGALTMAIAFILWALSIAAAIGFVWGSFAGVLLAFVGFRYEDAADEIAVDSAAEEPHLSRNEPPV